MLINLEYSLQFAQKTFPTETYDEMQCIVKLLKTKEMAESINKRYKIDPSKKQPEEVSSPIFVLYLTFSWFKNKKKFTNKI